MVYVDREQKRRYKNIILSRTEKQFKKTRLLMYLALNPNDGLGSEKERVNKKRYEDMILNSQARKIEAHCELHHVKITPDVMKEIFQTWFEDKKICPTNEEVACFSQHKMTLNEYNQKQKDIQEGVVKPKIRLNSDVLKEVDEKISSEEKSIIVTAYYDSGVKPKMVLSKRVEVFKNQHGLELSLDELETLIQYWKQEGFRCKLVGKKVHKDIDIFTKL